MRTASRLRLSVSGRTWRYFWVIWIWVWPVRSIADLRSAPLVRSQEAWRGAGRGCGRLKSMPAVLTAGDQIRVRKVPGEWYRGLSPYITMGTATVASTKVRSPTCTSLRRPFNN